MEGSGGHFIEYLDRPVGITKHGIGHGNAPEKPAAVELMIHPFLLSNAMFERANTIGMSKAGVSQHSIGKVSGGREIKEPLPVRA